MQPSLQTLKSDEGAHFDRSVNISSSDISPTVSWGTSPQDVVPITGTVPRPEDAKTDAQKVSIERAIAYMGIEAGMKMTDIKVDKVSRVLHFERTNHRFDLLRSSSVLARILESRIYDPPPRSSLVVRSSPESTR